MNGRMAGCAKRWMAAWMERRSVGRLAGWLSRWVNGSLYVSVDGWTDGRTAGTLDRWSYGRTDECIDVRMRGRLGGRMERSLDGAADGWIGDRPELRSGGYVSEWLCVPVDGRMDRSRDGTVWRSNARSPMRSTGRRAERRAAEPRARRADGRGFGRAWLCRDGARERRVSEGAEGRSARSAYASLYGPSIGSLHPSVARWFAQRSGRWIDGTHARTTGATTHGSSAGSRDAPPGATDDGSVALHAGGPVGVLVEQTRVRRPARCVARRMGPHPDRPMTRRVTRASDRRHDARTVVWTSRYIDGAAERTTQHRSARATERWAARSPLCPRPNAGGGRRRAHLRVPMGVLRVTAKALSR